MDAQQHNPASVQKRQGAYLPHWTAENSTYLVTFRLGDSLPQAVVESYRRERNRLLASFKDDRNHPGTEPLLTPGDLQRLRGLFSEKIDRYLDAGTGACWMNRAEIADLVQNALLFFNSTRYTLHTWAVMPNHVHVVFRAHQGFSLSDILHSWKSFTSKEANKLLGRTGVFWQAESYDHLIRDADDFAHCVGYTLNNPGVAGLKDWRWAGVPSEHRWDADAT